jgi:acetyl esterase/lipase
MKKMIVLVFGFFLVLHSGVTQTIIPLYDSIPNSKASADKESSSTRDGILLVRNITTPTVTLYMPANVKPNSTAVIICPGGGYSFLAAGHEGSDIAELLNDWGVIAFVLKYRLPDTTIMFDKSIGPLQDAQRAMKLVREQAAKWNIDPARIGIMGFSAGGHLAATASTHFDKLVIANAANTSLRPDFSVLIYPVISFTDSLTHMGSRNNLLGKNPAAEAIKEYSNEMQVTPQTPITFLVHAGDDATVPAGNSIAYYQALLKNKVPAELHLYQKGGHGFGMHNKKTNDEWTERLKNWMQVNKLL